MEHSERSRVEENLGPLLAIYLSTLQILFYCTRTQTDTTKKLGLAIWKYARKEEGRKRERFKVARLIENEEEAVF